MLFILVRYGFKKSEYSALVLTSGVIGHTLRRLAFFAAAAIIQAFQLKVLQRSLTAEENAYTHLRAVEQLLFQPDVDLIVKPTQPHCGCIARGSL